jgi:Tfp pilus assembly protein PilF
VSLLLDALKRAEQEKLARGDRPEPEPRPAASPPPAPALELHPISPGPGAKPPPGPQAAQVVFQAKAAPAANEPRSRSMLIGTIVGGILIVVVAAAAYVWHTLRTLTPQTQVAAGPRPPAAPVPSPPGAPPAVQSRGGFVPTEPAPAAPASAPPAPARAPAPAPAARPAELAVTQAPRPAEPQRALQEILAAGAAAAPPLRLERSAEPPRVPRDIAAGYAALTGGDLEAARRSYQAALATDGASVDALLGMATVEAQSGNRGAAAAYYRRVLEGDGRNATALAGLAALADHSRPEALESRLRDDLARAPDSAPLRFALGNLYASQRRWTEAQAEFFEAYRLDPTVGDVMHNLAVSLDHLGQTRLAAQFYARALEASERQATRFDPAPVARRLAELGR